MLAKAECDADFLVADSGQIRRQGRIKIPPVVIRAALDRDLEQPIGDALPRTAELCEAAKQPGNMRNIAQHVSERRDRRLFLKFHGGGT